ncbi:hypothetical protein BKP37_13130 [Anaerobacillus alkalilacustris]|uniref:Uncharacterized protein n=1 Tax=Anaerobacillus alkalilacustris TaxID=393763 RepID=A0A1S2LIN2_9BACI|nr:hypothetical protein BKP37_13130 [Anaerobacillus alkalilacustris]
MMLHAALLLRLLVAQNTASRKLATKLCEKTQKHAEAKERLLSKAAPVKLLLGLLRSGFATSKRSGTGAAARDQGACAFLTRKQ